MTDYNHVSRKDINAKILNYSFLNQFMLYLGLDQITRDDYYSLLLVFSHNPQLEFKHIIFLIGANKVDVSDQLKKHILGMEEYKWCLTIPKDFDLVQVI